ncbi:MAG TPA: hypothetical protein VGC75_05425, partial [Candidatus Nitrosocosmicus sp.]
MNSNNEDNYQNNIKNVNADNKIDINNDKIIYMDKDKGSVYTKEYDDNKLTTIDTNTNQNPFTVAMSMWQSYVKVCTDTYKQLFLRNPSM